MPEVRVVRPEPGPRDEADLAMLLTELSRLLRAFSQCAHGHPRRLNLLQRTFLLWQLELERADSINFERVGSALHCRRFGVIAGNGPDELIRAMEIHAIEHVRMKRDLEQDDFTRFVELLAVPTADLDEMFEGSFPARLYASTGPGVEVNDVPRKPPEPVPSLAKEPDLPAQRSAWPTLEENPFEAPAMAMAGEQLRLLLRELDRCDDDVLYDALLDRTCASANKLWDEDLKEETYRALLILTAHASGAGATSRSRELMAQAALESLVGREQLDFLIAQALDCPAGGVRPTQVLLQLGELSPPALLDALDEASDPDLSTQLAGLLLTLGENAVSTLAQTISRRAGNRVQLAVRLAGRLQSPKLISTLAAVLRDSGPAMRREAGKALVSIGNAEACNMLIEALQSGGEELARVAALCLGELNDPRAAQPLLALLDQAMHEKRYRLAQVTIQAVGQLSGDKPEIVHALTSILEWPTPSERPKQRGLRCAALEVLGNCDTPRAEMLLMTATRDEDPAVSNKAHEVLNERDRALSA